MKKIIARIILLVVILYIGGHFIWDVVIKPCMDSYAESGMRGAFASLIASAIVIYGIYLCGKIMLWALDKSEIN
jgi:uncharacterized membrane protein